MVLSFAKSSWTPPEKNFNGKNFCLILAEEFFHLFDYLFIYTFDIVWILIERIDTVTCNT